jgi:hypothetical protein
MGGEIISGLYTCHGSDIMGWMGNTGKLELQRGGSRIEGLDTRLAILMVLSEERSGARLGWREKPKDN